MLKRFLFSMVLAASLWACAGGEPASRKEQPFSLQVASPAPDRIAFETVHSIFEDSGGHLWFTSWHEGTARWDGEHLSYFTKEHGGPGLGGLQEDAEGGIWSKSGDTITRFDSSHSTTFAERNYTTPDAWASKAGDLWFGGDAANEHEPGPGVYRYDGETFTYLSFPLPEGGPEGNPRSLYLNSTPAYGAPDGTVWFGTMEGAFGFDGQDFTFVGREAMGRNEDPRNIGIRGLFIDSKGRLWLADNGAGAFVYDGKTVTNFTRLHGLDEDQVEGPSLHRTFSITEDHDGSFWFGTIYSGVWRYDGETFTHFGPDQGLTSSSIHCVFTDSKGRVWATGEGVFRFNGNGFERVF